MQCRPETRTVRRQLLDPEQAIAEQMGSATAQSFVVQRLLQHDLLGFEQLRTKVVGVRVNVISRVCRNRRASSGLRMWFMTRLPMSTLLPM